MGVLESNGPRSPSNRPELSLMRSDAMTQSDRCERATHSWTQVSSFKSLPTICRSSRGWRIRTGSIYWHNRRWHEYTGAGARRIARVGLAAVRSAGSRGTGGSAVCEVAVAAGKEWEDTFPLRSADGAYQWFLSRAVPLRDDRRSSRAMVRDQHRCHRTDSHRGRPSRQRLD